MIGYTITKEIHSQLELNRIKWSKHFDASSMRMVTFLAHEFVLDDIVCIISGPYQGTSGLLYAYEGDNLMVDVEHNAVPCKAKDLELVARKRLI